MVQLRDDVVGLDAADPLAARGLGGVGPPGRTSPTRSSTAATARSASAQDQLDDPDVCPNCGAKRHVHRGRASSTSCSRPTSGPVEDDGAVAYLRPETAQGMFVELHQRAADEPQEAAVRHRPDRQVVPQRDHARQLRLPHPRVRADGDGVLRAARRGAASGSSTGATSACAGTSTSASRSDKLRLRPARRRRASPLLDAARPTWSSSSRGAGASSRASPTAPTTTSTPARASTRARSSSTSTRPPTSATCRT